MHKWIGIGGLRSGKRAPAPAVPTAVFIKDDAYEIVVQQNQALQARLLASTARLQSVETENEQLRDKLHTATQTIENLKKPLETLEEDYEKFVSTVLDQINSPIHVIDGSTAFLSRDLSDLREALDNASLQSTSPNALANTTIFSETIMQMREHLNSLQQSTQQQTEATRAMMLAAFNRKISSNIDPESVATPRALSTTHVLMTPQTTPPPRPRRLKVLAVDDQELMLATTRKQLAATHTLETAMSGEAAIAQWQKAIDSDMPFDVIIMDICMPPGISGLEATKTIRERESEQGIQRALIVGLSGNTQPQDIAAGLAHGMDDYLTKPCNRERLLAAIAQTPPQSRSETTTSHSSPEMMGRSALQHDIDDTERCSRTLTPL